jgi:DNA polymerase-3 subunit gamma/tau
MHDSPSLNLARKWRSKTFDTIIGQELVIRMLKNSLYLDQYFPVYLFSGQRGCGKTTTARVWAAAVNCQEIEQFKKAPKHHHVPCNSCSSCQAMQKGSHPDFIEIDAASHTGVDNVRQIIEASTLLPLLGRKRIYLIDEAHMLSKAAFNAFLKILEEPPQSVMFMLATTDPQKILETVKSRCFQLFFKSVNQPSLFEHLKRVCEQEHIAYEDDGLELIIYESEGSVRDALNLLEQVRFAAVVVTKKAVLASLGVLSDEQMVALLDCILYQTPVDLMKFWQAAKIESYAADVLYYRLLTLVRAALWLSYDVKAEQLPMRGDLLKRASQASSARLQTLLVWLGEHESVLQRTSRKHLFLEMILLQAMQQDITSSTTPVPKLLDCSESNVAVVPNVTLEQEKVPEAVPVCQSTSVQSAVWQSFLDLLVLLDDPLLKSIFVQSLYEDFDDATGKVTVQFSEQFAFFNDWLVESKGAWLPLLKQIFGDNADLNPLFTGQGVPVLEKKTVIAVPLPEAKVSVPRPELEQAPVSSFKRSSKTPIPRKEKTVDVSDQQQWQKAHLILNYFPGTVIERG